ncbi:MAG: CCA tRNA nucleotidyltransferase [Brevundimonas sp.]|nr:MAG: CCA tRNA nucleotidyltransferase [Brevundimonas sp.]
MAALEAAGGPDCARYVGGCVRNALMQVPVVDVDIATVLEPARVKAALVAAGLKAVPTGEAHGTITAVAMGHGFEITTLRRDVSTDGRRAVVAFTTDWTEDAARRDFRLNSLYAERSGQVFDPTGEGVDDARHGRIVFVGDARTRIREDFLRILRFFRFHAWYGRGAMDAEGLAACADLSEGLGLLSAERVSKEMLRLLEAADPVPAVRAMQKTGVLARVLPGGMNVERFAAVAGRTGDPLVRLAALSQNEAPTDLAKRWRLSNAQRDRLIAMTDDGPAPDREPRARATLYRLGAQAFRDRLALMVEDAAVRDRLAPLADWAIPVLPVGGADVARLGLPAGPRTGLILKAFEADWIAADFPTDGHEDRLRRAAAATP